MSEAAAAARSVPGRFGPAARGIAARQARASDGDGSWSSRGPLRSVSVIARAHRDGDIIAGIVRVILRVGRGIRIAVAVRNGPDARLGLGVIDAGPQVGEGSAARLDQQDMTIRAGRADHV